MEEDFLDLIGDFNFHQYICGPIGLPLQRTGGLGVLFCALVRIEGGDHRIKP